jgi:type II secretory pathway component PulF
MTELVTERMERPTWLVVSSSIASLISLTAAVRAPTTLERFRELFRGFGADLSWISQAVLDYGDWIWWVIALPGVAVTAWVISRPHVTPDERRTMKIVVRSYSLVVWTALALFMWGLYAPIFKLGAVV